MWSFESFIFVAYAFLSAILSKWSSDTIFVKRALLSLLFLLSAIFVEYSLLSQLFFRVVFWVCYLCRVVFWVCYFCQVWSSESVIFVYYTPDIRSMWEYIVFAFPFVRSFVRTYVRSFVRSYVRSSLRHRVKVFALKFIRPHISKIL